MKRWRSSFTRLVFAFCITGAVCGGSLAQGTKTDPPGPTAAPKSSEKTVTVTVPEGGEHFVRPIPSPDAKQRAHLPQGPFKDKKFSVSIDASALGKSPKLAVDNALTGNTAIVPFPASGSVEVSRLAFDHVHRVEVTVTYDNKPVQVAQVTLTPESGTPVTRTVDAASKGLAVFEDVKTGKAKVNIVYGDNLTNAQDVVITTDHAGDKLEVQAPVSNKVPTVDIPVTPAAGASGPAPQGLPGTASGTPPSTAAGSAPGGGTPEQSGGGIVSLLSTLLGLGVAAGAIYLLFRWAQSGGMAATLKKVGVEVSGPPPPSDAGTPWQPNAPSAPVVADPSLCQFCGQRKDAAGNCLCSPAGTGAVGTSAGAGAAGSAVASQPRLVGTMGIYSGSIFPVSANGTPMTFGRDAGNSVSLADDTTVSRRHASLRSDAGGYIVTDEGSSNGIYVNGVRVSGSQPLRPGDEVQIGNTRFRFEL
jgi:hypothetical protein